MPPRPAPRRRHLARRRDQLRADGTWRDAAIHSILADEWPAVRAGLDARIAAQEGRPVLFRTPAA
ncbi:hypothetical protein QKG38_13750 [Clavibacter michiganensis]|uniref:hypothetical protein n=1 Tax=Clavibacter michiganensis TaxID=28447 RepID=UPI00201E1B9C|nr:hypothetical protein [Clavibacter michiganensis]MDO4042532.1 hypothetical protein [Clavibacter michiganensis]MDO4060617.1 hypothetical protein [Clavibacter michiganensis]MDO4079161.1 hypothetical protein [Clavibacter michiganensis]MDO4094902.1 hypothetical protein [Clavibacter michiganensis]MDO4104484.1 hypothetical protein [Clavibacter michiganensis]